MTETHHVPPLLALPAELIHHILIYLAPLDLAALSLTCNLLNNQSNDEEIWKPLVNRNLPAPLNDPSPAVTFRELYKAHHPHWFLPRNQIWFADSEPSGKLLLSRYDQKRGCIEAYQIVATRGPHTLEVWEKDQDVLIHSFNPKVQLEHKPVLKVDIERQRTGDQSDNNPSERGYARPNIYNKEILMDTFSQPGLYGSFLLARALPATSFTDATAVWPPLRMPSESRTRNATRDGYQSAGHRPSRLEEVSEHTFRLRKWVEYTGRRLASSPNTGMNLRMPEDITTYATLPTSCYTPTKQKPWQGIWCGDYSGHGCELLVLLQPDKKDARPLPRSMDWLLSWFRGGRRGSASSNSSYASALEDLQQAAAVTEILQDEQETATLAVAAQTAAQGGIIDANSMPPYGDAELLRDQQVGEISPNGDAQTYTGRIEAIKLTGDPNIPRGEYTFIAPDISDAGLIRVADEEIFKGARIVKSAGHIAGRGFKEDQYTPSQLIMLSTERLAQFWEGFGHISYYRRVDLDGLLRMAAGGFKVDARPAGTS